MNQIQIFASDHRKDVKWNLPYIRLGNFQSDSIIRIDNDKEIEPYQMLLSEGAQMWWVYKYLYELGNPDYVGFCHYRRFFSFYTNKQPLLDIPSIIFQSQYCMTPQEQLDIIRNNNLVGLVPPPLKITQNFVDIKQQLIELAGKKENLNIPEKTIDIAFDVFLETADDSLRQCLVQSMKNELTYVCNIFTLKREFFEEYMRLVVPACKAAYESVEKSQLKYIHPRFIGYILERFTSLYLHAIQLLGNKLAVIPLMTLDGSKHVKWEVPND